MVTKFYVPSERLVEKVLKSFDDCDNSLSIDYERDMSPNGITLKQKLSLPEFMRGLLYDGVSAICRGKDASTVSVISDSKERFNDIFAEWFSHYFPPGFDIGGVFRDWNHEFYNYVEEQDGFKLSFGEFYLDSGQVCFRTGKKVTD